MFGLFKSSKVVPDLSAIGIDMHSHLLPGLDDGLANIEDTVAYVQELKTLGYQKLICTPHILADVHPNTPDTILPKLQQVRHALQDAGVDMPIEAAAEYMVDYGFEQLLAEKKQLLSFGNNHVLIEMSYLAPSPNIDQAIFDLSVNGYRPILAHPERYNFYHRDFEQYRKLKDTGILFQVNLLSLSGYYGKHIKKVADQLIAEGMIDLIGTDMHHTNHLNATKAFTATKEFANLLKHTPFKNKALLG